MTPRTTLEALKRLHKPNRDRFSQEMKTALYDVYRTRHLSPVTRWAHGVMQRHGFDSLRGAAARATHALLVDTLGRRAGQFVIEFGMYPFRVIEPCCPPNIENCRLDDGKKHHPTLKLTVNRILESISIVIHL